MSQKALMAEIALFEDSEDYFPPELEDDLFNPANLEYNKTMRSLQMRVHSLSNTMNGRHALIAKHLALSTDTMANIARNLHCSAQLVSKVRVSKQGKELIGCLKYMSEMRGGTYALQREMLLYEIALTNKEDDPRTSIAAISEINRMKIDTDAQKQKIQENTELSDSTTVIVHLSDPRLLPTRLDKHPIKDIN